MKQYARYQNVKTKQIFTFPFLTDVLECVDRLHSWKFKRVSAIVIAENDTQAEAYLAEIDAIKDRMAQQGE